MQNVNLDTLFELSEFFRIFGDTTRIRIIQLLMEHDVSVNDIADTKTVIGDPITLIDGVTIIPVSRISVGTALGGGEYGLSDYLLAAGGILLVNRIFAVSAKYVNNAQVKKRIVNDTDYAYEFAYRYPEQAHICRELNPAYAANPDAVPAEQIRERLRQRADGSETARKIICAAGLGFLFLVLLAAIAFCMWVYRETT